MRPIIFAACVFAAACSGQGLDSPTSPTAATVAPAQTQAQSGTQLPFRGSLSGVENIMIAPPNLFADGTAEGNATHLGRFDATFTVVVDLTTGTGIGTFNFTAANGDQLFTTFVGQGVPIEPGVAMLTEVATIVGGTGRFAAATGTFTITRTLVEATSTSSESFEGHISLNK